MTNEPLFIRCEGSDTLSPGWCQMCGIPAIRGTVIPEHQRTDILAMLDRGDFTR
jgi:hypothetical protein